MNRLAGKIALVTGAARGQGRAHCIRMAEEGAKIIALDICAPIPTVPYPLPSKADLETTEQMTREAGGEILTYVADARSASEVSAALEDARTVYGSGIDIACVNHGILSRAPIAELDDAMWLEMIDVNLTGAFIAGRAAARSMIADQKGGSIIFTSSNFGLKGGEGLSHYTAAKHGVVGLARAMAIDLAPYRIRVNTVNPTGLNTPMSMNTAVWRWMRPDLEEPTADDVADVFRSMHLYPNPWFEPVEISHGIVYLASDESRYVTGISLPIDMGSLQR